MLPPRRSVLTVKRQKCVVLLRSAQRCLLLQDGLDSLLQMLVHLLSSDDINMLTCATGILSNLTCNNGHNKSLVTQNNGIEALIHAILRAAQREDIIEPAVCALRHLTSRHPQAELAQNAVRNHYGIPAIIKLVDLPYYWPVVKVGGVETVGRGRGVSLAGKRSVGQCCMTASCGFPSCRLRWV